MAKRHSRPYKRDLQDKALERLCKNLRPTLCGWLVCSRICDLPRVASGRGNDVFVKMMTKLSIALLFMFLSVVGYGQTWLRVVTCYDAGRFGAKTGIISKTLVSDVKIERYQGSDQCHITYIDNLGTKTHTPTVPNKPSNNGLGLGIQVPLWVYHRDHAGHGQKGHHRESGVSGRGHKGRRQKQDRVHCNFHKVMNRISFYAQIQNKCKNSKIC
jgi:hypothetical protein